MKRVKKPIPESQTPAWVGEGCSTRNSGRETGHSLAVHGNWTPVPCLPGSGFPASFLPALGQYLLSPFLRVDPHLWLYLHCRVCLYPITQASGLYTIKKKFPAPCKAGNTQLPMVPRRHNPSGSRAWLCVPMQLGGGCGDYS